MKLILLAKQRRWCNVMLIYVIFVVLCEHLKKLTGCLQLSYVLSLSSIIITITISSNAIGALAALFFTNHSVEL